MCRPSICAFSGRGISATSRPARSRASPLSDVKFGDTREHIQPPLCSERITRGCFLDHGFRNEQLETVPLFVPPLTRGFLVRCHDKFTASPRGEITDDRGLHVHLRFHGFIRVVEDTGVSRSRLLARAGLPPWPPLTTTLSVSQPRPGASSEAAAYRVASACPSALPSAKEASGARNGFPTSITRSALAYQPWGACSEVCR